MSAIYILWLRQMKRYRPLAGADRGSLGQPLLYLLALGLRLRPDLPTGRAGQLHPVPRARRDRR